jgi:hypothetical protein
MFVLCLKKEIAPKFLVIAYVYRPLDPYVVPSYRSGSTHRVKLNERFLMHRTSMAELLDTVQYTLDQPARPQQTKQARSSAVISKRVKVRVRWYACTITCRTRALVYTVSHLIF